MSPPSRPRPGSTDGDESDLDEAASEELDRWLATPAPRDPADLGERAARMAGARDRLRSEPTPTSEVDDLVGSTMSRLEPTPESPGDGPFPAGPQRAVRRHRARPAPVWIAAAAAAIVLLGGIAFATLAGDSTQESADSASGDASVATTTAPDRASEGGAPTAGEADPGTGFAQEAAPVAPAQDPVAGAESDATRSGVAPSGSPFAGLRASGVALLSDAGSG